MKVHVVLVVMALCACGGRVPVEGECSPVEGDAMLRPPLTWAAMQAKTSIFPQANGIIQANQGQEASLLGKPVRSEAELRAAIGEVAARFNADAVTFGGGIVIAAPFTVQEAIIIPAECVGLKISGAAGFPIRAASAGVSSLFDVRAAAVTFRDLVVFGTTDAYFTTFAVNNGGVTTRILDSIINTDRIYVDETSNDAGSVVIRNVNQTEVNDSHDASIVIASTGCRVTESLLSDGGGDTITLAAGAASCHLGGNDLAGGDVTTTASSGNNTIVGNTQVGTLTLHADDEEAANTP